MHSHCKHKQMSWEEMTGKKKMTDLRLGNVLYSSYQAGVSPEGELEVGQTLLFFEKPFACKLINFILAWNEDTEI